MVEKMNIFNIIIHKFEILSQEKFILLICKEHTISVILVSKFVLYLLTF